MAKLTEFPELLVVQQASGADAAKCPGQLVMMGIAIGEPVIVDEYPQLALAQCWAVEMRQIVDRRARRVHRRLVNQVDLAQQPGVARQRAREASQAREKRHARCAVFVEYRGQCIWQILDRREHPLILSRFSASRVAFSHGHIPWL